MSTKKVSAIEVYGLCLAGGIATIALGGESVRWIGYGLGVVGSSLTGLELINSNNPYEKIFKSLNLQINGSYPKLKDKRKTEYGECLAFSLPIGLTSEDFIKKQLAIEEHLNKKVEISYSNYRIYMKVFNEELEKLVPYNYFQSKNTLEFTLGKTRNNDFLKLDLEEVVHVLIAGETGSGKSTVLRSIITSLILSNKQIELHLIDLKNGVEFNVFRKSSKVKSFSRNRAEAEVLLNFLSDEVDKRTNLFYEKDVVDIREYNKLKNVVRLKYKVCIIDEFADLQGEKDSIFMVEELAAKARACGIHLIVATQRPDMKVLNGRIKANIPCVIGLKTMNRVNSQIIIDDIGLEKMRGQGHGLLKYKNIIEFQSLYLNNETTRDLIKHTYIEKEVKEEKITVGKIEDMSFIKSLGGVIDDGNGKR